MLLLGSCLDVVLPSWLLLGWGVLLILPLLVFPVTLVFLWGPLHLGPFQLLDLELNPGLGALACCPFVVVLSRPSFWVDPVDAVVA